MGCGSSSARDMKLDSPSTYAVQRVVGQGGFGKVSAVKSRVDGKMYAMKEMSKATVIQTKQVKMLLNERNLLVELAECRYLANMHSALQDDDACYLLLDLCLGGDMQFHLKNQGKLSEEHTKFYTAQLVQALDFLHSQRILHRDIKPANVLLDSDGYLKLTDLGISKKMKADGTYTGKSGTKPYMPPETLDGKPQGTPSDVYQLGITVCEMLCAERPWARASSKEAKKPIETLTALYGDFLSADCLDFLAAMLTRKAANRLTFAGCKAHPWFAGFDWDAMDRGEIPAPFIPDINKVNFETMGDLEAEKVFGGGAPAKAKVKQSDQEQFQYYAFINDQLRTQTHN